MTDAASSEPSLTLRADSDGIHLACSQCGELAVWAVSDLLDAGEEPSRIVLHHLTEKHPGLL